MDWVTLTLAHSRAPAVIRWLRTEAVALTLAAGIGSVGEITTQ